MGQFQSSVGLITGIPIQDTVNQLMEIAAVPRNRLQQRTTSLTAERTALDQLSSLLLGLKFSTSKLTTKSNFTATTATSSDKSLLTVTAGTTPPPQPGTYTFTPLQTATTHQAVSSSFTDVASQLSSGTFRIGVGGHLDGGIRLSELNSGSGFQSGFIRITDRSGDSAEIDLRGAVTVDDVLDAINANGDIDVTASVDGDSFVITDNTGGSGNLRVKEVGLGTTATSLGLANVNVAADSATGSDVLSLHSGTLLSSLNDGNGVQVHSVGEVLSVTLADNTQLDIDVSGSSTLGQIVEAINAADGTKLSAAISADGNRLELTDLSDNLGGAFAVTSTGTLAEDLGLDRAAVGGVITGDRLISGLRDTLVNSLNGGRGYEELTSIDITTRDGSPPVNVDLSSAETLSDIVEAINNSGASVTATINNSRSGIAITDTSGGSGNLTIASSDTTAASLGIAVDDAVNSVNSGSLNRQTVSESTLLTEFNGGKGVRLGDFRITDSAGKQALVSLDTRDAEAETIGDVIDAINALSIDVEARINDTGDGLLITDLAGGTESLTITNTNGSNAATDLRIATSSTATNGDDQQIIDGRTSLEIDLSTLEVSDSIALETLNNGNGITLGVMEITTSKGESFFVNLGKAGEEAFTVQDVVDKINEAAGDRNVAARINPAGTGIQILDSEGGNETLAVKDVGSGTTAAELKLTTKTATNSTTNQQSINGSGLFTSQDEDMNALGILVDEINSFDGGFVASTFYDGSGYRLSITSEKSGADQELLIDSSLTGFSFQDATRPKDAVLQFGNSASGGIVITSDKNKFENVVQGLTVNVVKASSSPITVEVTNDTSKFSKAAQDFVDSFNSLRTTIGKLTSFDPEGDTTGILFGRNEVLRIETSLAQVLTQSFGSSSQYRSLETLGISLNQNGELELDTAKLTEAFLDDPSEVQQFLSLDGAGVAAKLEAAIDQLAGDDNSLIARRYDALTSTIENNEARISSMDDFLARERERTLFEFYALEQTISQLQSNIDVIDSIQYIAPVGRSSNS